METTATYQRLEQQLSEEMTEGKCDVAVCSSGTAALHLALEAIKSLEGLGWMSVHYPEYTMNAVRESIRMAGLSANPIKCDYDTLCMNQTALEEAIRIYDANIILDVHTYGLTVQRNLDRLTKSSKVVWVLNDLAEAHGTKAPNNHNTVSVWSFYKNKIVGGQEGGAVTSSNTMITDRVRVMRSLAITDPKASYVQHDKLPAFNYRMSDANAELVLEALANKEKTEYTVEANLRILQSWIPEDLWKPFKVNTECGTPWVMPLLLPPGKRHQTLVTLQMYGIEARPGFLHYSNLNNPTIRDTHSYYSRIIYLPLKHLKQGDVHIIKRAFELILKK